MKIYTRTGDNGDTALWGGKRVSKDAERIQAYGTVDECNAVLGIACASLVSLENIESPLTRLRQMLLQVQNDLFVVGSDLASEMSVENITRVVHHDIERLELWIDEMEAVLPPLTQFILPGGIAAASHLHLARTVCRRAERWVVSLQQDEDINTEVLLYLNRLSDFLFVAARYANHANNTPDIPWKKPG